MSTRPAAAAEEEHPCAPDTEHATPKGGQAKLNPTATTTRAAALARAEEAAVTAVRDRNNAKACAKLWPLRRALVLMFVVQAI